MKFSEFERIMSPNRMRRYLLASGEDTRKAMTLYRKNLQLSQELFTVIGCFEVALRNRIDEHYSAKFGQQWLKHAASNGGMFDNEDCRVSARTIKEEIQKLRKGYSHGKLVAQLGFGFWRYLFSSHQYRAGGQSLIQLFVAKPSSSREIQYNAAYIFKELQKINDIRNRIAHHEPICFSKGLAIKNTIPVRQHHNLILQLFQWMQIDEAALLYGLDHIHALCTEIDQL